MPSNNDLPIYRNVIERDETTGRFQIEWVSYHISSQHGLRFHLNVNERDETVGRIYRNVTEEYYYSQDPVANPRNHSFSEIFGTNEPSHEYVSIDFKRNK